MLPKAVEIQVKVLKREILEVSESPMDQIVRISRLKGEGSLHHEGDSSKVRGLVRKNMSPLTAAKAGTKIKCRKLDIQDLE